MNCLKLKAISFACLLTAGLPVCAEAMQWPDTAQTLCYDNTKVIPCPTDENSPFYGQDAQYQGTARSYTKLGQGGVALPDDATEWIMVRDNVTGLTWEMKNNDDGVANYSDPHDSDNTYVYCQKDAVGYQLCGEEYNDTEDFVSQINSSTFGGYSDWRIPNIKELQSLIYDGLEPLVNWNFFKKQNHYNNVVNYTYWSSTPKELGYSRWYVKFSNTPCEYYSNCINMFDGNGNVVSFAGIGSSGGNTMLHVRAVRGGN